jgi:hypothetical protein
LLALSPAFKLGECYLKYRASSNKRKLGVRELILWRSREFSIIRLEIKVETLLSASVGLLSFSKAKCRFTMYCTFSQLWKCCPIALLVGLVCSESRVCKRLSVFPIYVAEQPGHVTSLFVYSIFNKYKTFSVLIYSYINTSGNWENEKLCGNTTPEGRSDFTQFRVFPISTSVDTELYINTEKMFYIC